MKGAIDNIGTVCRLLISDDTELQGDANVVILLAHKPCDKRHTKHSFRTRQHLKKKITRLTIVIYIFFLFSVSF